MGSGRTCEHVVRENLRIPKPTDSVYREDCTQCFDSIDDPTGLDLCLTCFNGGCTGANEHAQAHHRDTSHPLVLNIRRSRKIIERDEPPLKISKLAITAETESDRYDTTLKVKCLACGADDLDQTNELIGPAIDSIMIAATFARKEEVKEWYAVVSGCDHIEHLVQGLTKSDKYASVKADKCSDCDLTKNLWMCLECCNIGCGRDQGKGMEGNGHAIKHHGANTDHVLAVKIGSLANDTTPDVYCYATHINENGELDRMGKDVTHDKIKSFLEDNGLDLSGRIRTEKTMGELSVERNLNFAFNMKGEDGKEATPLFGPGLTGLKNMGNTCYLASILQCLYDIPSFQTRFNLPAPKATKPAQDLETQLRKIGDGLLSGRYSKPDSDLMVSENSDEKPYQKGLTPAMLKHLIGRDHEEFSTTKQQDAYELMQHLLDKIATLQHPKELGDPAETLRFVMEQRLQCRGCSKVRYSSNVHENVLVNVPVEKLPPTTEDDKEPKYKPVTLKQCLDILTATEDVDLACSSCGSQGFTKRQLFKTFPDVLVLVARKIIEEVPGKYAKVDVPVIVDDDAFDMDDSYFSLGQQPDEELLLDEPAPKAPTFTPNQEALAGLLSMGFPEQRCIKALYHTSNSDPEAAVNWYLEHQEDPDIDAPLVLPGAQNNAAKGNVVKEEHVQSLLGLGLWDELRIRKALFKHDGNPDAASEGLFGDNTYDEVELPQAGGSLAKTDGDAAKGSEKDMPGSTERPAKFQLQSIVCHKGSSIHAGHYVAFIRKMIDGKPSWVLFNDEKVAKAVDAEDMKKSAYIYFFKRA